MCIRDSYTHFTSPIRRYPDLLVHRMVREYGKDSEVASHFEQVIPDIASQSSSRERRAIDAEREVEAMKKAEYMEEYVGEEYDALAVSYTHLGRLPSRKETMTFKSGFVAILGRPNVGKDVYKRQSPNSMTFSLLIQLF